MVVTAASVLNKPEYHKVKAFVDKVKTKMIHVEPDTADKWVMRILAGWAGAEIFRQVSENTRKMEIVLRVWKTNFFGFGVEDKPSEEELTLFRDVVTEELRVFDWQAKQSKQKHKENRRDTSSNDDGVEDYFSQEMGKLWNARTSKVTVAKKAATPPPPPPTTKPTPKSAARPIKRKIVNPYERKRAARVSDASSRRGSRGTVGFVPGPYEPTALDASTVGSANIIF